MVLSAPMPFLLTSWPVREHAALCAVPRKERPGPCHLQRRPQPFLQLVAPRGLRLQGAHDACGLAPFAPDGLPDVRGNVPRPLPCGLDAQLFAPRVGRPCTLWWPIRPDRRPAPWGGACTPPSARHPASAGTGMCDAASLSRLKGPKLSPPPRRRRRDGRPHATSWSWPIIPVKVAVGREALL